MTRKEVYAPGGVHERAVAGDKAAISEWNQWCAAESKRYAEQKRDQEMFAVPKLYRTLWGG